MRGQPNVSSGATWCVLSWLAKSKWSSKCTKLNKVTGRVSQKNSSHLGKLRLVCLLWHSFKSLRVGIPWEVLFFCTGTDQDRKRQVRSAPEVFLCMTYDLYQETLGRSWISICKLALFLQLYKQTGSNFQQRFPMHVFFSAVSCLKHNTSGNSHALNLKDLKIESPWVSGIPKNLWSSETPDMKGV